MERVISGESTCLTTESSCRATSADSSGSRRSQPLVRHSSSPAGFLSNLLLDLNGYSSARGLDNYPQASMAGVHALERRLKPQLSFSRQDFLPRISETGIPDIVESINDGNSSDDAAGNVGSSYIASNFSVGSWDNCHSIAFSAPSSKWANCNNGGIIASLGSSDSQLSLASMSVETGTVQKFFQGLEDPTTCKVRAKRGCATHPRSIAERERRTRISKRLKKLHDFVPNMDKQTSTSDMLDLAVRHIRELQSQIEKLRQEQQACTCASKS